MDVQPITEDDPIELVFSYLFHAFLQTGVYSHLPMYVGHKTQPYTGSNLGRQIIILYTEPHDAALDRPAGFLRAVKEQLFRKRRILAREAGFTLLANCYSVCYWLPPKTGVYFVRQKWSIALAWRSS